MKNRISNLWRRKRCGHRLLAPACRSWRGCIEGMLEAPFQNWWESVQQIESPSPWPPQIHSLTTANSIGSTVPELSPQVEFLSLSGLLSRSYRIRTDSRRWESVFFGAFAAPASFSSFKSARYDVAGTAYVATSEHLARRVKPTVSICAAFAAHPREIAAPSEPWLSSLSFIRSTQSSMSTVLVYF